MSDESPPWTSPTRPRKPVGCWSVPRTPSMRRSAAPGNADGTVVAVAGFIPPRDL